MPQVLIDDGVALVYDDFGPTDGIPVVLCHAVTLAGAQFAADAAFLAGRGYRVLVPDVRGHGRSGKPSRMDRSAFTIARMADDLVAMLDHAAVGPVHWVGNSMGGILGLELLARHEPRFKSFASFGTLYALGLPRWGAHAIPWSYTLFGKRAYAEMAAWGMTSGTAGRNLIAGIVAEFDPEVGLLAGHNLARYDLMAAAHAAKLPILLLRGGRDPQANIGLGRTLRVMRRRSNFTLVDLPQGSHCANLDATDMLRQELLQFWQRSEVAGQRT